MSEGNGLELFTMDELVAEINRRSEAFVVSIILPSPNGVEDRPHGRVKTYQNGGYAACLGLCKMNERAILDSFMGEPQCDDEE